jgi:RNA polymerase sigma factor (sigma-70 family)
VTPILPRRPRPERTFERLYQRHASAVYRYALAVLRNSADAEDATQTTFLNAYRALERGERPHEPHHWLISIAHNVCRQRFRDASRRPREVELDADAAEAHAPEESPSAEDIRRALGHLSFNQRTALVMRELEGRSYAEIGELLGVSLAAVETLVFRARRALREQLEGSLSCAEAELALSKQLDGRLVRAEAGALRAHIRECPECGTLARRVRAQRGAFARALGAVPLPASLLGGGAASIATGVAAKAAAVTLVGAIAAGTGYEGVKHTVLRPAASRSVPVLLHRAAPVRHVEAASRVVALAREVEPIVRHVDVPKRRSAVVLARRMDGLAHARQRTHERRHGHGRGRAVVGPGRVFPALVSASAARRPQHSARDEPGLRGARGHDSPRHEHRDHFVGNRGERNGRSGHDRVVGWLAGARATGSRSEHKNGRDGGRDHGHGRRDNENR